MSFYTKKWWPAHEADEVMPPPLSSPDDYILRAEGILGAYCGREAEYEGDEDAIEKMMLSGDCLSFMYCVDLGEIRVQFSPDKSFKPLDPIPTETNTFYLGEDPSFFGDSLAQLAETMSEEDVLSSTPVAVRCLYWSDHIPFALMPSPATEKGFCFKLLKVA